MADVFISYAHEDQAFARLMVPALEAEGFSVWWDHTIPPGQSWDTFIARNIEEARCCIVLWSGRSVGSDWVKEEATLAKDAGKLIPVQIDAENPPVGFRRIQAAQLAGWQGDTRNSQWQMLASEVRRIVSASRDGATRAPRPAQTYEPSAAAPSPSKSPSWGIIGAIGAAALIGVVAFVTLNQGSAERLNSEHQSKQAVTEEPPAAVTTEPAQPDSTAELERLRRENDELALSRLAAEEEAARERRARETIETQQRQQAAAQAQREADRISASRWEIVGGDGVGFWQEFQANGTFRDSNNQGGTWTQSGNTVRWTYVNTEVPGAYTGIRNGDRMSVTLNGTPQTTFAFTRTRSLR